MQLIISGLDLLDSLSIRFYITTHRATTLSTFEISWSPNYILIIFIVYEVLYFLIKKYYYEAITCLLPLTIYFISPQASISVISLLFSIFITKRENLFRDLIKWLFIVSDLFLILIFIHWTLFYPLNILTPISQFADLENKLYYIFSLIIPVLSIIFFYSWILIPHIRRRISLTFNQSYYFIKSDYILVISLLISILTALYPYINGVNPNNLIVGVDAIKYIQSLDIDYVKSNSNIVINNERPFFFLILKIFKFLTNMSIENSVKYFPTVLLPVLVFSTYFFSSKIANKDVASWSSFFMATGPTVVSSMYSYFLSNILGLIFILISLGLLFNSYESGRKIKLLASIILGSLCLFTHPWTFTHYVIGLLAFIGYIIYREHHLNIRRDNTNFFIYYITVQILVELLDVFIIRGLSGSAALSDFAIITDSTQFWHSFTMSLTIYYGGALSNPIELILGTIGLTIGLLDIGRKRIASIYIIFLQIATSFGFLMGNEITKSRLFINTPLQCFASLGLISLASLYPDRRRYMETFVILYSLVYLFRFLANLV